MNYAEVDNSYLKNKEYKFKPTHNIRFDVWICKIIIMQRLDLIAQNHKEL